MKKIPLLLFLCISLTLSLGIFWAGPAQAGANEQLSPVPSLENRDGSLNSDVLTQVSDWVNDHFFLRQELISLDHALTARIFGISGESSVILGKDGWLFYGSTLADYTGQSPMTPQDLQAAAGNLGLMARYCTAQGRDFLFVIAPNKNSLYPEYMPDYPQISAQRNAQTLMELLSSESVAYVDLFSLFAREDTPLYFATDSHWNSQGAALAADAIHAALGKESHYGDGPFTLEEGYTGDLFQMLYPGFSGKESQPLYAGAMTFRYTTAAQKPDSITLQTAGDGTGQLLVYRDSFGNLLYPYLANSAATARFSRSVSYDLTLESDALVIELVERNLRYLITYVPVMPAPTADVSLPGETGIATIASQDSASTPEGYTLWRGQLPQGDGPVYVQCGEAVYEAFRLADGEFALYLPQNEIPQIAACQLDGSMISYRLKIS